MEFSNDNKIDKQNNKTAHMNKSDQVLKEIKLVYRKSSLLKFQRDTDNLDFDGRQ